MRASWQRILVLVFWLVSADGVMAEKPPNILIITCDNLGYGDLSSYSPKSSIKSPNLDRLAAQGARLTSFYTASPTCTVSRACLLTGRLPERHGLKKQLPGVAGNSSPAVCNRPKIAPFPFVVPSNRSMGLPTCS